MHSANNEATTRRRSSKRDPQSRPSVDSEYGAQIGRNDTINLNPPQALSEENWSRSGNDDDRQEFRHRPSFPRISTEPPSIARAAPPSLESRSLSFPGTAGPNSSLGPHLDVPTANPGWSSHSDNATESTVTGSYDVLPTNIHDSKLPQRTRNLNHRTIVNGHNPNFRSMQDGTSSTAEESPFIDLDAPGKSNSPTATATLRPHESNSQANFSGSNSYVNPTHYMAPHRIAQPQPISAASVIGKGRSHEVHTRREKRSMGSVPGNLSDGPPTCVGDTSKLDHAPPFGLQDRPHGHSMVHFEGISSNQRTEYLSSEVDGTGYPSRRLAKDGVSLHGRSLRPTDVRGNKARWPSATDWPDDGTSHSTNRPEHSQINGGVGMSQGMQGIPKLENDPSPSFNYQVEETTPDAKVQKWRAGQRQQSSDSETSVFGVGDHWLLAGARAGSPRSIYSSGSSTVKEGTSSMSSSLIQDTPPGSRPSTSGGMVRLDPVTESSSSDNSSLGEVGGSGDEAQPSPSGFSTSSHGSASTKSSASRNLETLPEYRISLGRIKPLGKPTLVPFKNEWRLKKTMGKHISRYMCSSILYDGLETVHQLWDPRPTLKATDGKKRGIEVGDLVHLNDYGEIMVLFNIFLSREENVARGATPPPEPYEYLEAIFNPGSHLRLVDIQRRKTYMSNNIRLVHPSNYQRPNKMSYEFTTTKDRGDGGAIVVLPDGGVESSLNDSFFQLPLVKKHFLEHAPSWYQHARLSNMKNGSLYLVRKTYCARSWGIAAFASNDYVKDPITAKLRQHGPHEYLWETQDNRLKTSVYPSGSELEALQLREPPLNQCMGVVLSSLRLDDRTWQTHFTRGSNPTTPEKASKFFLARKPSSSSSDASSSHRSSLSEQWSLLAMAVVGSVKGNRKQDAVHRDWGEAESGDGDLLILET